MKKKIAFITNSYKAASEVWIWRQVQYLKSNIGYIGLFENTIENFYENIPLVNLLDLPVYRGYNLNETQSEEPGIISYLEKSILWKSSMTSVAIIFIT